MGGGSCLHCHNRGAPVEKQLFQRTDSGQQMRRVLDCTKSFPNLDSYSIC